MTRRQLVRSAGIGLVVTALDNMNTARGQNSRAVASVKALVFDTFGTVVDWRGSIIREGVAWGRTKRLTVDWAQFADQWRAGYAPSMNKVRNGELPWTNLDPLHRAVLEELLQKFRIEGLTESEKDHWNRVWHRLRPWPDSVTGLARLKKKFTIAPLSNGNVGLLTEMAKNAGLSWDLILSAELARHYKPDREAYLIAPSLLGLKPEEVMMCAAHLGDLRAAGNLGLRTAFIHRPNEYGPTRKADAAQSGDFDIVSTSITDMASKLGA